LGSGPRRLPAARYGTLRLWASAV